MQKNFRPHLAVGARSFLVKGTIMKSIYEEKAGSVARHRDSATVSFKLTFVAVFCFDVSLPIASYST